MQHVAPRRLSPRKALSGATAIAGLVGACGDSGTASSPTAVPPSVVEVQIHIIGGHLKVGGQRRASATVRLSDGTNRSVRPQWASSDPEIFSVSQDGVMTGISAGTARLRATYMQSSNERDIRVVSVTPPPGPSASPFRAVVVISELRSRGGRGENDEFVELHNVSDSVVDLGGWSLAFSEGSGATSTSGNIPSRTLVSAGCFYLFTGSGITSDGDIAIGDFLYDAALDDDGGVAVVDTTGRIMDQVGFSAGSLYVEGDPLRNPSGGNHERKGLDTNDNAQDFQQPGGIPESSQSACRR